MFQIKEQGKTPKEALSEVEVGTLLEKAFRVECLPPLHLVLLWGFYLAPLFGTYSSVSSFCLICIFNPMCLVG